jgi:hypothetical protein
MNIDQLQLHLVPLHIVPLHLQLHVFPLLPHLQVTTFDSRWIVLVREIL